MASVQKNIVWSGGFDSTALLLKMMCEATVDDHFDVISFVVDATANYKEDAAARCNIKRILKKHRNYRKFDFHEVVVNGLGGGQGVQAMIWPGLSLHGVSRNSEMEVYYGYIQSDQIWHFVNHIRDVFASLGAVIGAKIKPVYPFEWDEKRELVHCYAGFKEVFNSVSWAGDTATVKGKEKEELENIFQQIDHGITLNSNEYHANKGLPPVDDDEDDEKSPLPTGPYITKTSRPADTSLALRLANSYLDTNGVPNLETREKIIEIIKSGGGSIADVQAITDRMNETEVATVMEAEVEKTAGDVASVIDAIGGKVIDGEVEVVAGGIGPFPASALEAAREHLKLGNKVPGELLVSGQEYRPSDAILPKHKHAIFPKHNGGTFIIPAIATTTITRQQVLDFRPSNKFCERKTAVTESTRMDKAMARQYGQST